MRCAVSPLIARTASDLGPRADIHQTKPPELKEQVQKKVVEAGGNYIQTIPPADIERVVVASEYAGTSEVRVWQSFRP